MRPSGSESDTLLFLMPVAVIVVVAVMMLGGPGPTLELIDDSVVDALHWIRTRL